MYFWFYYECNEAFCLVRMSVSHPLTIPRLISRKFHNSDRILSIWSIPNLHYNTDRIEMIWFCGQSQNNVKPFENTVFTVLVCRDCRRERSHTDTLWAWVKADKLRNSKPIVLQRENTRLHEQLKLVFRLQLVCGTLNLFFVDRTTSTTENRAT